MPYSGPLFFFSDGGKETVGQSRKIMLKVLVVGAVLLAGANFWERRAKNRAIMSILGYFWSILDLIFGANFCGKSRLVPIFTPFATMLWRGPLFCDGTNYD